MFAVNILNNNIVDNFILLVSNFHGNRLNGLRVMAVESPFGDEMKVVGSFIIFPESPRS